MPAAFIGHGSPMNALEVNNHTSAWRGFGQALPRPRAVLVVSAHWYINATAVTAMARPRTIHDFYGFPRQLFDVQYPAPGLPDLVDEVSDAVKPTWVGADVDSWGIDHGAWSVLVHVFPDASIPVVQLSINADKPLEYHVALGTRLAALRDSGVLILGSGNIVHNLASMTDRCSDRGFDWAERFNEAARTVLTSDPEEALRLTGDRDYGLAVPTPDHFIPMLYIAGAAGASGSVCNLLTDGYAYGSLSMASYTVGLDLAEAAGTTMNAASAAALTAPGDQTNI
jgi:4,5-DOPA dioxygenase extradiol